MTWAPENPVSIRCSIRAAREGARSIREVIGDDIWQATNELYLWFMGEEAPPRSTCRIATRSTGRSAGRPSSVSASCAARCCTTSRWTSSGWACCSSASARRPAPSTCTTTSRAPPRAQQPLLQTALWLSLLRACSGFEAFMRRQQGRVSRDAAVSLPAVRGALPALAALLRPLGAGARPAARLDGEPRNRATPASRARRARRLARHPGEGRRPALGARAAHPRRRRGERRLRRAAGRSRRRGAGARRRDAEPSAVRAIHLILAALRVAV